MWDILQKFIPEVEGFTPKAIWDYKQYSYGYGTKAPTSGATISKPAAMSAAMKVLEGLYKTMKPKVKKPLNPNQWAALLSFAFNVGNADKIIETINAGGSPSAVAARMKLYIYAGGKVNQGLVNRRNKEAALYMKPTTTTTVKPLLLIAAVVTTALLFLI